MHTALTMDEVMPTLQAWDETANTAGMLDKVPTPVALYTPPNPPTLYLPPNRPTLYMPSNLPTRHIGGNEAKTQRAEFLVERYILIQVGTMSTRLLKQSDLVAASFLGISATDRHKAKTPEGQPGCMTVRKGKDKSLCM